MYSVCGHVTVIDSLAGISFEVVSHYVFNSVP
jgi:hypothetical protein